MLVVASLLLLGFAPPQPQLGLLSRPSTPRSRPMVAPMDLASGLADLPALSIGLPQHAIADMGLRQLVYAFRLAAGVGVNEGTLLGAELCADARMFLTSSTVGTVRSARGLASANGMLEATQHAAMLLHHPILLCRWASRQVSPSIMPAIATSGRSVCAALWLTWIVCVGLRSFQQLGESEGAEQRALQLTLHKLALDVPLACHFLLGAALLPLFAVGILGLASSMIGMRIAIEDPKAPPTPRVAVPMPQWPLRRFARTASCAAAVGARAAGHRAPACAPEATSVSSVASSIVASSGCVQPRRRLIASGPLSSSCEW